MLSNNNAVYTAPCKLLFFVGAVSALCMILLTSQAFAAEEDPVRVTSDKLAYDAAGRTVTFTGSVHVTHPDGELDADKVVLTLAEKSKETTVEVSADENSPVDPGRLEKITAVGNVFVKLTKGQTGTCEKAVYLLKEGKLTMTGNPVLTDGTSNVRGKVVNFYVRENRSEVIGADDKRVEAIFSAPKRSKN